MRRSHVAFVAALVIAMPATAWPADSPAAVVTRAVEAMAPTARAVPGGYRFTMDGVAVSVLADETAGLLRVVAGAGEIGDPEMRLVASALSPDMIPDLGVRMVSVRGLMCAAVLAPLRGLTDGVFRRAVDGAVQMAREAAGAAEDDPRSGEPASGGASIGEVPAVLPSPGVNLPVHVEPTSR